MAQDMLNDATQPTWIEVLIKTYEDGGSDIEVCKAVKVPLNKLLEKYESDPKFRDLIDYGRLASNAWWLTQARLAIKDKTFNTPMWAFVMKNRFGWADKTESIERLPDSMADVESLRNKMRELLPGIIKQINPGITDAQILKDIKLVK